jgi:hypothetical protein
MAVEAYPDQLEPENQDAVIWRFMDMKKFRDLVATAELYFCRATCSMMSARGCRLKNTCPSWA